MSESLSITEFLATDGIIFDVRSPAEFAHAHIPGAINLPIFDNHERALVGTAYKQQGQDSAIQLGLELIGPKLIHFVTQAKIHCPKGLAKVHCWRGGMRSGAMTWLLGFAGIRSIQLRGGYKAFRKWALSQLAQPYQFLVLGGMTGCGKTAILKALKASGEQVIDLEFLARHRGSSFGQLGLDAQPSNEEFENTLATHLSHYDKGRTIWIEDESRCIGTCYIPNAIFSQMSAAPFVMIDSPLEERIDRLMTDYGLANPEELITACKRIQKRLGSQRTKEIVEDIQQGQFRAAFTKLLQYYDAAYSHALGRRSEPLAKIYEISLSPTAWAQRLKQI